MPYGAFDPIFLPLEDVLEDISAKQDNMPRAALISAALVALTWAVVFLLAIVV